MTETIPVLYIAADGDIQLFETETRFVDIHQLPDPYPGDTQAFDPLTGLNLPHLTTESRQYERIEPITVRLERGIRRLVAERDALRERLRLLGEDV